MLLASFLCIFALTISDNRQKDLVRIVFFAFDRLEEILPPTFGKTPHFAAYQSDPASSSTTSINSEREKKNITRVLNSKVRVAVQYILASKLNYTTLNLLIS